MAGGHKVVFLGPGTLQLTDGGKEISPGESVTMPDIQRASLTAAGMRFGAVPDEPPAPDPAPEPPPLESADVSRAVISAKTGTAPEPMATPAEPSKGTK